MIVATRKLGSWKPTGFRIRYLILSMDWQLKGGCNILTVSGYVVVIIIIISSGGRGRRASKRLFQTRLHRGRSIFARC